MDPACNWITPSMGAIGCRSTATIFGRSCCLCRVRAYCAVLMLHATHSSGQHALHAQQSAQRNLLPIPVTSVTFQPSSMGGTAFVTAPAALSGKVPPPQLAVYGRKLNLRQPTAVTTDPRVSCQ
jgi:hypothetical protein